ncbi:unnamed protein product [Acanthoscelides obtectus]|uniref:Uncharacterized protein n=1 Tax=Acanthoscelides obtectus TaxID=200917 RepID=A0A9P0PVE1_ACAOB|nr:unnamed protein product [Acanthoscelides obtectus]CAK1669150.1 hypothetical protein AOBTE_LOCUS26832 [Acanthoscelides obtectus]
MGLSTTDMREIKSTIINTFNEKFLQEIVGKVVQLAEKQFEERFNRNEEEIQTLCDRVENLEKDNRRLIMKMDDQEQMERSQNVRIFGLKEEGAEDLGNVIVDLFQNKLKVNIQEKDIVKYHRIPNKNSNNSTSAVLVRFTSSDSRASVLKNRKLLKNTGIRIKEDLTKSRLKLFKRCIDLFTKNNAWILRGNIYVKQNNEVHRIASDEDLHKINV